MLTQRNEIFLQLRMILIYCYRFSVVIFTFSDPLGLYDSQPFESRVALNPGLGGVREVASAIISYEQTQ